MSRTHPMVLWILLTLLAGCAPGIEDLTEGASDGNEVIVPDEVLVTPCTHPVWSEDPQTLAPLELSGVLPIQWGHQGLPMSVLGVRVEPMIDVPVNISVTVTIDEVVASVYYVDKLLIEDGEAGHFFNLFMITDNYKMIVDTPALLHMVIFALDGTTLGESMVEVSFLSP